MRLLSEALGPDVVVFAFGSRARGEARTGSDLDLLLHADSPLDFGALAEAGESLAESDLPFKVDLLDDARISDEFRQRIAQDLVKWGTTAVDGA
ncbi:nucleotidyltransferase family protein [Marinobacterium aestuariivivens]|uniref:Nucleotidyltransferase family protein n=1 Tax=Marinobacterium aestuariivivens TaxID=1698799 RepID=A0ABW1ZWZ1_9GAMM